MEVPEALNDPVSVVTRVIALFNVAAGLNVPPRPNLVIALSIPPDIERLPCRSTLEALEILPEGLKEPPSPFTTVNTKLVPEGLREPPRDTK